MTGSPDYLFVYGTLTKDSDNEMSRLLQENAKSIGGGIFAGGILYRISWYPGLVKTADKSKVVHGEVYRMNGENDAIMQQLDFYEDIGPSFEKPYEYQRELHDILCGGKAYRSWVYVYQWGVDEAELIPSGRFSDRKTEVKAPCSQDQRGS
jgi:gamma-glutamylcyclotransferase (GGCT)/AIG2-like uncharacterized protein YtfP